MNFSQTETRSMRESLQENTPRWILYWVIATVNANLIGLAILNKLPQPFDGMLGTYLIIAIDGLLLGAFVGTLQWLLLAVRMPKIKAWIPATALAYVIFLVGLNLLLDQIDLHNHQLILYWGSLPEPLLFVIANSLYGKIRFAEFLYISSINVTFGLTVGTAQWFLLRNQRKNAAWWIPIHFLCTFFASLFGYRTDGDALSISTFFIIYPILSAVAMDIWFKIRMPETKTEAVQSIYQGSNDGID